MPKRYYDAISDGGPGEDDARYASAHYNEAGQHYQHYQQRQAHIGSSSSYQQPSAAAAAAAGTSSTSPATSGYSPTHSYTTHAHPHPLDLAPIIPAAHASSSSNTSHIPAAAPVADAPSAESSATSPTDRERPYTRVPYEDDETYTYVVTPEMRDEFFREVHGRQLNTMQPLYQLPADDEEIKVCALFHRARVPVCFCCLNGIPYGDAELFFQRQEYFHKMMYMVMGDKNFVGPVEQVLSFPSRRRKQILDIGTGSGLWCVYL